MPRGRKSKLRAREKRRQARGASQPQQGAQAPGGEEGESSSCAPLSGDVAPSSSADGLPPKPQGHLPAIGPAGAASRKKSGKGPKSRRQERAPSSVAATSTVSSRKEFLMTRVGILIHYLLEMYQMKRNAERSEMLKILHRRFRRQFPEILQLTTEWACLLFDLEMKEVKPGCGSYTLSKNLGDTSNGCGLDIPMNGLLMPLLGLIFLNGNSASEKDVWQFLNKMSIYASKEHIIFGEPRKFITEDLVQKKYLVYRQVPRSDPPSYEFLWGPRAHAEANKMKVLEFFAKINGTVPSAFPQHYAQALKEQEERARARAAASQGVAAQSIPGPGEASKVSSPE